MPTSADWCQGVRELTGDPVPIAEQLVAVKRREELPQILEPDVALGHELIEGLLELGLREDGQLGERTRLQSGVKATVERGPVERVLAKRRQVGGALLVEA